MDYKRPELLNKISNDLRSEIVVIGQEGKSLYNGSRIRSDTLEIISYLQQQGLRAGTRVGIRAVNSYEWLILDFALITLGCTSVCIPAGNPELDIVSAEEMIDRFDINLLFQEQGFETGDCESVQNLSSLFSLSGSGTPLSFSGEMPKGTDQCDIFTVVFSSGTTGRLKRLPISWSSLQLGIETVSNAFELDHTDRIFDILPLSIFQQRYLAYCAMYRGGKIILSTQDLFFEALKEGNPTVILGPPAFYEIAEQRFNRWPEWKRRASMQISNFVNSAPSMLRALLRKRLFRSLHQIYGNNVRVMLVGSAPINMSTLRFFERAGFPLYQIYGMTECGWIAWNRPSANKLGTVGMPAYPGAIAIGSDGEVLVRNPKHLCRSYEGADTDENNVVYVDSETISTGDIGEFDADGFLKLVGRKKNVIITAGGQKISPENIEDKVKSIGKIDNVVVFYNEKLRALAAAIWVSEAGDDAQRVIANGIKALNRRELSTTPVMGLAFSDVSLSVETGLLTRNLKIDRMAIQDRLNGYVKRVGEYS